MSVLAGPEAIMIYLTVGLFVWFSGISNQNTTIAAGCSACQQNLGHQQTLKVNLCGMGNPWFQHCSPYVQADCHFWNVVLRLESIISVLFWATSLSDRESAQTTLCRLCKHCARSRQLLCSLHSFFWGELSASSQFLH